MPKYRIQRVQDAVHGLMEFHGAETVIINVLRTPELQRLRRIKQIGLGHLVYPGAEHSRLVHSLGASYLAIRFAKHLEQSSQNILTEALCPNSFAVRDLAVAALCHDLGHGPLSHAWEREIVGDDYNFDNWIDKLGLSESKEYLRGSKWHELAGHALLLWEDGHLHKLLELDELGFSKRLSRMLRGQYYLKYLPRLLNGDIDVDRADFLLRDTHQCGVTYGQYNLDWLISTCTIGETGDNNLVIGYDKRKGVRIVEQFLVARRALYETVYHHKTVRSAEGMVSLFLRRFKHVLQDGTNQFKMTEIIDFIKPFVKIISGEALEPYELLSLDDYSLSILIDNVAKMKDVDDTLQDLAVRILARDLFKIVPCNSRKINNFLRKKDAYPQIHTAIRPYCRGITDYYLYVDTVKFSMFSENDSEFAYFIDDSMKATPVREHELLRVHWQPSEERVRLYTVHEAVESVKALIDG
jgi:hypothetical protein